jgi:transposase-like protein
VDDVTNLWKWRKQMTTWTTEDRMHCVIEEMQKEIKELQDQLVIANMELTIAMAEVEALRYQLITATQGKH